MLSKQLTRTTCCRWRHILRENQYFLGQECIVFERGSPNGCAKLTSVDSVKPVRESHYGLHRLIARFWDAFRYRGNGGLNTGNTITCTTVRQSGGQPPLMTSSSMAITYSSVIIIRRSLTRVCFRSAAASQLGR